MTSGNSSVYPAPSTTKNHVLLVGTLYREPTIHKNKQGQPMAVLDLHTESPETGKLSDFHNLICFGGLASWCGQHLHAGMGLCVHGQLSMRRWKQGGAWRTKPQVIVRQVYLAPAWSPDLELAKLLADSTVEIETDAES